MGGCYRVVTGYLVGGGGSAWNSGEAGGKGLGFAGGKGAQGLRARWGRLTPVPF